MAADAIAPSHSADMPASAGDELTEQAPAKVNLTLRITGRLSDGYHTLESLVVFADIADRISLAPGDALGLTVTGPGAAGLPVTPDNLVLRAARALAERVEGLRFGHFTLDKNLPVAAGIGGGSADAAAALRLLARLNGLAPHDPRLAASAVATGADVPACLLSRPLVMRGIGDLLSPASVPALAALLVNPGVEIATQDVFTTLDRPKDDRVAGGDTPDIPDTWPALLDHLQAVPNDLQPAARRHAPAIDQSLAELRALPGARLVRMSGSGATCFALFEGIDDAQAAADGLHARRPGWWIAATHLKGSPA